MITYSPGEMSQIKLLENEVDKYLSSKMNSPKTAFTLNKVLSMVINNALLPSKNISVIWVDKPMHPFLMAIYPSTNELYEKSEELSNIMSNPKTNNMEFVKKWSEITNWSILIESRLLTKGDRFCVDSGAEFIALLYHEVGHVFTESPMRLISNYKLAMLNFNMMEKMILTKSKIARLLLMPMFVGTLTFSIILGESTKDATAKEIAADMYVPSDYRGALLAYIDNHILNSPESKRILVQKEDFDNAQNVTIEFSRSSIEMLRTRRDMLARAIQSQYHNPTSLPYHKELMKFIGRGLLGYSPDDDRYLSASMQAATENAFNRDYKIVNESAHRAVLEAAKITDRELDVLQVQIQDISTPEDKMYFIHKVYDYIEAIGSEDKKLFEKRKSIPETLAIKDNRLERLSNMRKEILSKDVSSHDRFGLYIKYPAGYEG